MKPIRLRTINIDKTWNGLTKCRPMTYTHVNASLAANLHYGNHLFCTNISQRLQVNTLYIYITIKIFILYLIIKKGVYYFYHYEKIYHFRCPWQQCSNKL